jgi:hypothetical protein
MTNWGPGAIPPGYMLAPDGTLVPIPPANVHGPAGFGPSFPGMIAHPADGVYGAAMHPGALAPPVAPAVSVSITVTSAPQFPAPIAGPSALQPLIPGYPGPIGPSAALPPAATVPVAAASHLPAPYAPSWSDPSERNARALAIGSHGGLALARDEDSALQRERYQGDSGSLGALSIATSGLILASALATVTLFVVPVGAVLASAAVASGITGGMGLWLLRQRRRARGKVDLDPEIQVRLLDLAAKRKGRLTVTAVAQGLGLTLDESERALQSMSRSNYVDVELDPELGVVTYVFRELLPSTAKLPASTSEGTPR